MCRSVLITSTTCGLCACISFACLANAACVLRARARAERISTPQSVNEDATMEIRFIHRDLTTRNLLLTSDQQVKICDFGCARYMDQESYSSTTISGRCCYQCIPMFHSMLSFCL
jgi:serine/threonine protein kinase